VNASRESRRLTPALSRRSGRWASSNPRQICSHGRSTEWCPAERTAALKAGQPVAGACGRNRRGSPAIRACASNVRALFGAKRLVGLDTQASPGRANRGEQSDDRHEHGRNRQQRAAEEAEHLAFARQIDHERQHPADHDACRELQRRPGKNASQQLARISAQSSSNTFPN